MRVALMNGPTLAAFTHFDGEIPEGWTPAGGLEVFAGVVPEGVDLGWKFEDEAWSPPVLPVAPAEPHRVSRIYFARLFSGVSQVRINALRKAVAALTVEDYADPSSGLLVQLEIVFQQFDLPDEFIELDHPDTALALGLLGYAGVFGAEPAGEIARIIAGTPPG